MPISQLLLCKRPDGTLLFSVGYHEAKFQAGTYLGFGAFQQRDWLQQWHGARPPVRIGS
ncbi:hypothetical protein Erwinia_phage_Pastis_00079 [Erwinia phage Pastis]|nr:hypothetical protein Erwinia_phage_Pastis_00079 [Erwinia phage Pastis]